MKNWTRRLCVFMTVCLLMTLLPISTFAASKKDNQYTDQYGTWIYQEEEDGTITIIGCENTEKNIVVPARINGKPVRKLGARAFKNNDTITAVVIPYGVETIEAQVFFGCSKLERVDLPTSVTTIEDKAFSKCESLGELYIPSSVEELGQHVFKDSPNVDVH